MTSVSLEHRCFHAPPSSLLTSSRRWRQSARASVPAFALLDRMTSCDVVCWVQRVAPWPALHAALLLVAGRPADRSVGSPPLFSYSPTMKTSPWWRQLSSCSVKLVHPVVIRAPSHRPVVRHAHTIRFRRRRSAGWATRGICSFAQSLVRERTATLSTSSTVVRVV